MCGEVMYIFGQFILQVTIILEAICIGVVIADKIDVKTLAAISKVGWVLTLVYFILRW